MDHIPRVSEVLYVGLCRKIGTPTEVTIRRDVLDMKEMIETPLQIYRGERLMMSGSYREGFRFESSDLDRMLWGCHYKLISDISQSSFYTASGNTIILMDSTDTPPGFVRLQLLTPTSNPNISSSLVLLNDRVYISSSQFQQQSVDFINNALRHLTFTPHGPCATTTFQSTEIDHAYCFASIHWPVIAQPWVDRSLRNNWPPVHVLADILKHGCHCVPIASKTISSENELEWRLSFSQAEQKLVYAMNHTQFLCYGLLKIFQKEVLKEPLCSYFMKTTMFWIIQADCIRWCPRDLLNCFWTCFKYLIQCVYRGEFPNFFIPQNNMFLNKVVGHARTSLLEQLNRYYRMGVSCLLHSKTLRSILLPALISPSFVLHSAEGHYNAVEDVDRVLKKEIFPLSFHEKEFTHCLLLLKSIDKLSRLSFSPYQTLSLQHATAEVLTQTAFVMLNNASCCTHRQVYILDKTVCNMLRLAARVGSVTQSLLYLALYYYRMGRYNDALHVTYLTKQRLSQPYIMYRGVVDNEAVGRLSLSRKMKTAWVDDVRLDNGLHIIKELILEQEVSKQNGTLVLIISPFVLTDMLSVLCNYRLSNISQYLQSLTDLQTLLISDDGRYVPLHIRDLSWQILGICQHVVGDLHGALQSYQESLRQRPSHTIQKATEARIQYISRQFHGT
ncbi:uncharacterized protein LOC125674082 [Ostrea edulis]|uniref:uncharacterized protein LOC125674082 n=1 Tax=Ostrea edulis TaxID=37623 RepID=UPI0024AE90F5|nr:uncharacterized protein LOC125674082 [Ostrea edulis]